MATTSNKSYFRIRTITCFIVLEKEDFVCTDESVASGTTINSLERKIQQASAFLNNAQTNFTNNDYTVQTVRIATNPFGEWIISLSEFNNQIQQFDILLQKYNIEFCSVGPATTLNEIENYIIPIIELSHRLSCSASLYPNDTKTANVIASTILRISQLTGTGNHIQDGIGNFRFCCASANTKPFIPFFPAAKSISLLESNGDSNTMYFAIGFENGALLNRILSDCCNNSFGDNFQQNFSKGMLDAYSPIQTICEQLEQQSSAVQFVGIDTSINPSLDDGGSVAAAMEGVDVVSNNCFGQPGTLAVTASLTQCLQSLSPTIKLCGYCGLMLPVCEDQRLAQLVSVTSTEDTIENNRELRISDLLSISQVCGVGVDTVPIPGDCSPAVLASLLLDVTGIAHRWNKSLSCRVFPVPNKKVGEWTTFNSPYLVNSKILPIT